MNPHHTKSYPRTTTQTSIPQTRSITHTSQSIKRHLSYFDSRTVESQNKKRCTSQHVKTRRSSSSHNYFFRFNNQTPEQHAMLTNSEMLPTDNSNQLEVVSFNTPNKKTKTLHDNYTYSSFSTPNKTTLVADTVSPNSKTPHVLKLTNGKPIVRRFVTNGMALYTNDTPPPPDTAVKKLFIMDSNVDDAPDTHSNFKQLFKINSSWRKLKTLAPDKLTNEFILINGALPSRKKRYPSQNTIMGGSARIIVEDFINNKSNYNNHDEITLLIKDAYKQFLLLTNGIEKENTIRLKQLEHRHLAPFAVLGHKAQNKRNLATGPAYTNTIELCIEKSLIEISRDLMITIKVKVVEYTLNQRIGLLREYHITNNSNQKNFTLEFPILGCVIKPHSIFKTYIKQHISDKIT